ncbi:MAG TPA: glycoside hydrolase family 3 N-terminal domain-containing protein [Acidimicrobiales bacterium]|nr:glycoside hydrolase family 3 N-terminal domain-containing protein [Acidimicrobiales bacterium]
MVSTWPLERRAAQLIVVPADERGVATALPAVRDGVGGVILFGPAAPVGLGQQLAALKAQAPGGIAPFVMTDEEGGGVQRLSNLVGDISWPRAMAASLSTDAVRQLGDVTGRKLVSNGVDMDLAPVLDLDSGPGPDANHTDGPRSFSSDPNVAAAYGIGFAQGLMAGGALPVVKHFPGEGQATANSDYKAASTPPLPALKSAALVPFERAVQASLPAVMVGNAAVPGLSAGPASLSPAAIGNLLRGQLGFRGLVLTDSLSATSIRASGLDVPHAAVQAVAAGADMILYDLSSTTDPAAIGSQLVAAVGSGALPESRLNDAVTHVLAAKKVNLC